MQHKARQGEYTGGHTPFGRRVAADGARLEPHPQEEEARAVARQLRAQGLSLRAVAAELERRGLRSRTGRAFAPVQSVRSFRTQACRCLGIQTSSFPRDWEAAMVADNL
jgi:hypothetical protein